MTETCGREDRHIAPHRARGARRQREGGATRWPPKTPLHPSNPGHAAWRRALPALLALCLLAPGVPARAAGSARLTAAARAYFQALSKRFYAVWVQTVIARVAAELGPDDPFNQPRRQVVLRLRFAPSGTIRSATVVRSSGHRPFDVTARSAVLGIYDYPVPPATLRSDDGDVYLEWTFQRSRPWCHHRTARVVRVPFTRSLLRSGHYDRAVALLQRAAQTGRLRKYARDFGRELVRLAARTQGSRVAPELVPFLSVPLPLSVLRVVFRDPTALDRRTLPVAARRLARQRTAGAGALLAALVQTALRSDRSRAVAFLAALAERPAAVRHCRADVVRALAAADPRVAAAAARALALTDRPADRRAGRTRLRALLTSRRTADRLAAIAQLAPPLRLDGDLLAAVQAMLRYPPPPASVRAKLAERLGRYRTPAARRLLLLMSYTRDPALQAAVARAFQWAGAGDAGCYRLLSLLKARRARPRVRESAAAALARHCLRPLRAAIYRLARRGPASVRRGLARGLPLEAPAAAKLLRRLARDPKPAVRRALLLRLSARSARHAGLLRSWQRRRPRDFAALRCRIARVVPTRAACLAQAQPGQPQVAAARRLAAAAPDRVFPWVLRHLRSKRWRDRLQAAWVLWAIAPRAHAVTPTGAPPDSDRPNRSAF